MIYKAILVSTQLRPDQVPPSTDLSQDKHKWKQRQRHQSRARQENICSYRTGLVWNINICFSLFAWEKNLHLRGGHYNINGDVVTEDSMNHVFKAVKSWPQSVSIILFIHSWAIHWSITPWSVLNIRACIVDISWSVFVIITLSRCWHQLRSGPGCQPVNTQTGEQTRKIDRFFISFNCFICDALSLVSWRMVMNLNI